MFADRYRRRSRRSGDCCDAMRAARDVHAGRRIGTGREGSDKCDRRDDRERLSRPTSGADMEAPETRWDSERVYLGNQRMCDPRLLASGAPRTPERMAPARYRAAYRARARITFLQRQHHCLSRGPSNQKFVQ